jgi:filamentous hemagglutinin
MGANTAMAAGIAGMGAYTANWGRTQVPETGNTLVTDWGQRGQAYALNTVTKGVLNGAQSTGDWTQTAVLGAAGEGYQYFVGHAADARPGVGRADPKFTPVQENGFYRVPQVMVDGVLREGKNIGLNEACTSIVAICHGTPISNITNLVPGMNSFATLHDNWGTWLKENGLWNSVTNIGSMPPALLLNYGSLLDQYPYLQNQKKDKK